MTIIVSFSPPTTEDWQDKVITVFLYKQWAISVHNHSRISFLTQLCWKSCLHLRDGWKGCWAKTVTKSNCQLLDNGIILHENGQGGGSYITKNLFLAFILIRIIISMKLKTWSGRQATMFELMVPWWYVGYWTWGAGLRWPIPHSSPLPWSRWTLWGGKGWPLPWTAAGHNAGIPATHVVSMEHLVRKSKDCFWPSKWAQFENEAHLFAVW